MMAGLAYMTGPPGRPLRAGSSVNDIMGGMFGVIGALAALAEREHTGKGHATPVQRRAAAADELQRAGRRPVLAEQVSGGHLIEMIQAGVERPVLVAEAVQYGA